MEISYSLQLPTPIPPVPVLLFMVVSKLFKCQNQKYLLYQEL